MMLKNGKPLFNINQFVEEIKIIKSDFHTRDFIYVSVRMR